MPEEIKNFDAQIIGVGNSIGFIIPSHIIKYVGLKKGQKLKVKLEIVDDKMGLAGFEPATIRMIFQKVSA